MTRKIMRISELNKLREQLSATQQMTASNNISGETILTNTSVNIPVQTNPPVIYNPTHVVISIDLGIKNLGYTIFRYTGSMTLRYTTIEFGIWNCTEHINGKDETVITSRSRRLVEFFKSVVHDGEIVDHVIIEKQVNRNTMAMGLMYATVGIALTYTSSVKMFDPKKKFTKIGVTYSTHNKDHKKQSASYAMNVIRRYWPTLLNDYCRYTKKDDIADSLNQALVWLSANGHLFEQIPELRMVMTGLQK